MIVRPLTADGMFGLDEFGQKTLKTIERGGEIEVYTFVADVRDMTCGLCERGWEPTGPSIGDQYHWDLTDSYVHLSCYVRFIGFRQRAAVWRAMVDARLRFGGIKVLPNNYWGPNDPWGKGQPWYQVELTEFPFSFVIGMRKRVWSIDLTPVLKGAVHEGVWRRAEELFRSQDVTKHFGSEGIGLHAWGESKMIEYVGVLASLLKGDAPRPFREVEIKELRDRERTLIDTCHAVDAALRADPPQVVEALEKHLEAVRLWSYPVEPKR